MIRDNFIESARTGWGNCKYVIAPTDLSAGVPDPSFNLFENYLMGYVPTDKSGWTPMRVDISGSVDDGQSLKLTRHKGKIGWTYTTNCLNNRATLGTIKRNNTNFWTTANYNPMWNILQDFVPAKYTCYGSFYLAGIAYKPTPVEGKDGWETIQNVDYYGEKGFVIDVNAVDDFFAGNYTTSITVNNNTYRLNLSNWNPEYNRFEIKENDTIVLCFSIRGIVLTVSGHYYDGSPISSSTEPGLLCVGLTQKVGDNVIYSPQITNLWTDQQMSSGNTCISLGASGKSVAPLNGYYSGDPNGASNYGNLSGDFYYDGHTYWGTNIRETDLEIPTEFFQWLWSYNNSPSSPPCVYKGIPMTYIGGNRIYAIRSSLPLNLAKTAWYLINKVNLTNSAINGYSYNTPVSIFNSDDSPSYKRRSGTDEALDPILRPWQKLNAHNYDDEFTDSDIPDPSGEDTDQIHPDPIEPTEREDIGAMPPNMNNYPYCFKNFTTGYILSAGQLEAVGHNLWDGLSNNNKNMAKNFYLLGNTGWDDNDDYYLTMSNIIDYFISLRWYPISATKLFSSAHNASLTVGAGTYPLLSEENKVDLMGSWHGIFSGGSVTIPKPKGFYEYEPYATASIYVPFCGTIDIEPSILYGRTINLEYAVDATTGSCTAYVTATLPDDDTFIVSTISGTLGFDMLLTGNNAQTVSARAINSQYSYRVDHLASAMGAISTAASQLILNNPVSTLQILGKDVSSQLMDAEKARLNQPLISGLSPLTAGSVIGLSSLRYICPAIQIRKRSMWNEGAGYDSVGFICDRPIQIKDLKNNTYFTAINPNISGIEGATQEELNIISSYLTNGCFK